MSISAWNTRIVGGVLFILLAINIALFASRTQLRKRPVAGPPQPAAAAAAAATEPILPTTLQYGKRLDADFLRRLEAHAPARSKVRFVLLVSTPDFRALEYLQAIGEKYRDVLVPTIVSTSALEHASSAEPSVIVIPDWVTRTGLKLAGVGNLLLVVDDQGVVKFVSYGIPDIDILRQLAEKYARDRIDYERTELELQRVFTPGGAIPRIEVVRLGSPDRTLKLADVLPAGGRLFVMTARCNACQLSKFDSDISRMRSDAEAAHIATAVLITEPGIGIEGLSPALVPTTIAENAFAVARGYFLYDPVTTRIGETSDRPIVVDVARDHTITKVQMLPGD